MRIPRLGRAALAATALLLFVPSTAAAGPWTPEPGHGYAKLWSKWLYGLDYYDANGDSVDIGQYHELVVAGYAELGIGEGWAAYIHTDLLRYFKLEDPRTGESERHFAPGDPQIGIRWRFLKRGRFVVAFETAVRGPVAPGERQDVFAANGDDTPIGALRVGQGTWDFTYAFSAGYGWDRGYIAASSGFIYRFKDYDSVVTWSLEGGGQLVDRLNGRVRLTGYHSLTNGDPAKRHNSPSGLGSGTRYIGVAIEGDYEFVDDWFVGLVFEGAAGYVRRQMGGPVMNLYFATRF